MKTYCTKIMIGIIAVITATSCIYDAPGDRFYRTLWESADEPLGDITLEFLCNDQIMVTCSSAAGSYGTYESDGTAATFADLTLTYPDRKVTIREGHRDNDLLFIVWTSGDGKTTQQTQMHRLSAYK